MRRTVEAVFRIESARLIARLTRMVKDVGLAEELAQDALLTAIEKWPESGVPDNPGAWLMTTAKNRAINMIVRNKRNDRKHEEVGRELDEERDHAARELDEALDDNVGDDLLRLIFIACHPVLSPESRSALTLRLLGGLTTEEIARAFLMPEPTVAQRIVRAKRTLSEQKIPFEVPRGEDLAARLSSVLEVIYLIFNEGYSSSAAHSVMRPELSEDALRLGRIVAELVPSEPEVHGLVALMELHLARSGARRDASGNPVLLLDQNRARWDRLLIRRGLAALGRADALGRKRGPYALQAAISACHARANVAADTNWRLIAALYAELYEIMPSPIVELNRAIAVSMADGPAAGLAIVDVLRDDPSLEGYHLLPSARADLLMKLERYEDAAAEFEHAASLARHDRDRALLLERAEECASKTPAKSTSSRPPKKSRPKP